MPSVMSSAFNWIMLGTQAEKRFFGIAPSLDRGILPRTVNELKAGVARSGDFLVEELCPLVVQNNFTRISVDTRGVTAQIVDGHTGQAIGQPIVLA